MYARCDDDAGNSSLVDSIKLIYDNTPPDCDIIFPESLGVYSCVTWDPRDIEVVAWDTGNGLTFGEVAGVKDVYVAIEDTLREAWWNGAHGIWTATPWIYNEAAYFPLSDSWIYDAFSALSARAYILNLYAYAVDTLNNYIEPNDTIQVALDCVHPYSFLDIGDVNIDSIIFRENFVSDDGGFHVSYPDGGPDTMFWEWCGGTGVWATDCSGDYLDDAIGWLISPEFDLTGMTLDEGQLLFMRINHDFDFEATFDGGQVEIQLDGGAWFVDSIGMPIMGVPYSACGIFPSLMGFTGADAGLSWFDITPYIGRRVRFRFTAASDVSNVAPGWEIGMFDIVRTNPAPIYTSATLPTMWHGHVIDTLTTVDDIQLAIRRIYDGDTYWWDHEAGAFIPTEIWFNPDLVENF
ncbi:hypothetical protein DRQ33_07910, partial [bacterium]